MVFSNIKKRVETEGLLNKKSAETANVHTEKSTAIISCLLMMFSL
jgi:hypothetical protein